MSNRGHIMGFIRDIIIVAGQHGPYFKETLWVQFCSGFKYHFK